MTTEALKREAAGAALRFVEDGMRLGLGSGSTARHFVDLLGERVRAGLTVTCVASSEATQAQAESLGIPLTTLNKMPELDLCVDGADEIGPGLALVKGGGGALLREKIVAAAASSMVVIADESKLVDVLGAFPLPVEVVPFGLEPARIAIVALARRLGLSGTVLLRGAANGHVFVTDGGHQILDCHFSRIEDPAELAAGLVTIPGVVEHGLFLNFARKACVAGAEGVRILDAA